MSVGERHESIAPYTSIFATRQSTGNAARWCPSGVRRPESHPPEGEGAGAGAGAETDSLANNPPGSAANPPPASSSSSSLPSTAPISRSVATAAATASGFGGSSARARNPATDPAPFGESFLICSATSVSGTRRSSGTWCARMETVARRLVNRA